MTLNWSARYIGIPWSRIDHGMAGTHCYGLARLVYRDELGIKLPDLGHAVERSEVAMMIEDRRRVWPWNIVAAGEPFDLVLFRAGTIEDHVGLIVEPGLMLHVSIGQEAQIDELRNPAWAKRIVAMHRHHDRMGAANV